MNFLTNNKHLLITFLIKSTRSSSFNNAKPRNYTNMNISFIKMPCDMNVGENEQLQMKCRVGLKSKPQNLKNLLAVISCGISYKEHLNDLSKFQSALIRDQFRVVSSDNHGCRQRIGNCSQCRAKTFTY